MPLKLKTLEIFLSIVYKTLKLHCWCNNVKCQSWESCWCAACGFAEWMPACSGVYNWNFFLMVWNKFFALFLLPSNTFDFFLHIDLNEKNICNYLFWIAENSFLYLRFERNQRKNISVIWDDVWRAWISRGGYFLILVKKFLNNFEFFTVKIFNRWWWWWL